MEIRRLDRGGSGDEHCYGTQPCSCDFGFIRARIAWGLEDNQTSRIRRIPDSVCLSADATAIYRQSGTEAKTTGSVPAMRNYPQLPLGFERSGNGSPDRYMARGQGYTIGLEDTATVGAAYLPAIREMWSLSDSSELTPTDRHQKRNCRVRSTLSGATTRAIGRLGCLPMSASPGAMYIRISTSSITATSSSLNSILW